MLCVWQQRAACVFEEPSSTEFRPEPKTRRGQWQSTGCVTRGMCTNLIYRHYTSDISHCMRSVPVSVMIQYLRNRPWSISRNISVPVLGQKHGPFANSTLYCAFLSWMELRLHCIGDWTSTLSGKSPWLQNYIVLHQTHEALETSAAPMLSLSPAHLHWCFRWLSLHVWLDLLSRASWVHNVMSLNSGCV